MKLTDLMVRCYTENDADGSWFALCLDLNLYARADSLNEAKAKLNGFIQTYLKEALTSDKEHASDLLYRPAPLYFQLRYRWLRLKDAMFAAKSTSAFLMPMPIVPA